MKESDDFRAGVVIDAEGAVGVGFVGESCRGGFLGALEVTDEPGRA